MATLPVIANAMRVAFLWTDAGNNATAVNVMHFRSASTDTAALNTALNTNVTAGMFSATPAQATITQLQITPLDGTTATAIYTPTGAGMKGGGANGETSPASAVVVSLRTALRGRRHRGRVFLPFVLESAMAYGKLTFVPTAMNAAWATFMAAMNTASMPLVVASYGHSLHKTKTSGGGFTMTPVSWTPEIQNVNAINVEQTLGTMRPRQTRLR